MIILGIGIDIIEVDRIEKIIQKFGERFLTRCFVQSEIVYCQKMKCSAEHFAARFAAKEAVSKAFGVGIGNLLSWKNIEIEKRTNDAPQVYLHKRGLSLAKEKGVSNILVSLSHCKKYAVAQATILGGELSGP